MVRTPLRGDLFYCDLGRGKCYLTSEHLVYLLSIHKKEVFKIQSTKSSEHLFPALGNPSPMPLCSVDLFPKQAPGGLSLALS